MSRKSARTKISFLSRRFQPQANQNVNEDRIPDSLPLDTLAPLSNDLGRYDDLVMRAGEIIRQRNQIYGSQSAKTTTVTDLYDYPQSNAMRTMLNRLSKRTTKNGSHKKVESAATQKKTAVKLEKLLERATKEQLEAGQESDDDADDAIKTTSTKKRRRIESESGSDGEAKAADTDDDAEDGKGKKDGEDVKPNAAAKKLRDADEELSDDVGSLASSEMSETAGDYGLNYVDEDYSELEDADNDYAGDY